MPNFDPNRQWGNYALISTPYAPEELRVPMREALKNEVQAFLPEQHWPEVVWQENDDLEVHDPETGEIRHATAISWKWTPGRNQNEHIHRR